MQMNFINPQVQIGMFDLYRQCLQVALNPYNTLYQLDQMESSLFQFRLIKSPAFIRAILLFIIIYFIRLNAE